VVGYGSSVVGDEPAWVVPSEVAALRARGVPAQVEILCSFASASTTAEVSADLVRLSAALPDGAIANSVSWLDTEGTLAEVSGINTPFVVAFAILGLVLAVLIGGRVGRRTGERPCLGFERSGHSEKCDARVAGGCQRARQ
jgi:putative ABC transport system permease protein